MNWLPGLPGGNLLRQAWDATKLGLQIRGMRKERALVLAQKNQVAPTFRRKKAIQEIKRLFDAKEYEGLSRALLPDVVVDKALDFVDFWWKVWDMYWIFVLLRVIMVFSPSSSGYIHPDEYFQSTEVVLGDVLELETHHTWEFNKTAPLRSPSLPFLVYGLPVYLLSVLNWRLNHFTGWNIIGPFLLELIPRLIMLLLSFSVDFMIYQICKMYKHSFNQCLTTLASSYIMLVYSTRTFSNSIELFLTSLLLYLVAHTIRRTDETVFLQELVQDSYKKSETVREKVEIQKKRKKIPEHDFKFIIPIGVIVAVGIFNRPTFFIFSFVPLFFWFQRGISQKSMFSPFQMFNFRLFLMIPIILISGCIILFSDSLYWGELTLTRLWNLQMSYTDWKFSPFNFIMYNAVPGNVASHGSHPYYTHLLVNLPLLLGPLAPIFVLSVLSWFSDVVYLPWKQKPGVRSVYALTLFSSVLPILGLSLVKHQEARFLIPILPCVILMCSHKLRWKINGWKPMLTLWYAFNILATIWFGFIHQAGVLPIQRQISSLDHSGAPFVNLVYSHTYMPPRLPLMSPKVQKIEAKGVPCYALNKGTKYLVHDLGGTPLPQLHDRLLRLLSRSEYVRKQKGRHQHSTLLVLPTHLLHQLHALAGNSLHLQIVATKAPHVSVEALSMWEPVYWDQGGNVTPLSMVLGSIYSLQQLSLALLNVTLGQDVSSVEMPTSQVTDM